MHRRAANFDSDQGVELANCSFKRCEFEVLVREDPVLGRVIGDTDGNAGLQVLFEGLEPRLSLRLLEDVVEDCLDSGVR